MSTLTHIPEDRTGSKVANNLKTGARVIPVDEMRSLKETFSYKNKKVVERLEDKLKLKPKDAAQLFKDVLLFLYVCAISKPGQRISPPKAIDDGWHEFLVFTSDYYDFCQKYFGRFIHHSPFTRKQREKAGLGPKKNIARILAQEVHGESLSSNWGKNSNTCGIACTLCNSKTGA
jgi:hypothetical protein